MKKNRVQNKFLDELREMPNVSIVCKSCGLSRNTIYRWRIEDPNFASLMNDALEDGEEFINDICESKLLTLIKEGKFPAIRFRLEKCHPKYRKKEKEKITEESRGSSNDEIIKILGLTPEDFKDDKLEATRSKIDGYLRSL